jgi:hypothetical protein
MTVLARLVVLGVVALGVEGCAKVCVAPADPNRAERQGIPFYLQRPYVVVKKEFPAEGEEGYLVATLFEQGGQAKLRITNVPLCVQACMTQRGYGCEGQRSITIDLASVRTPLTLANPHYEDVRIPLDAGGGDGIGTSGGGAAGGATTTAKTAGETDNETTAKTRASMTAKYDPAVDKTIDASEFMTIAYLADLDEKYTIDADAGLGMASLGVALGAGGTLNQFAVDLDNREAGKFVFESLGKFRDLAFKKLKWDESSTEGTPPTEGDGVGTSGGVPGAPEPRKAVQPRTVILKYIYIGNATPGAYPILKAKEYQYISPEAAQRDPYLVPAVYPYTRYAVRVRRELSLYLDKMETPKGGGRGNTAPSSVAAAAALLSEDRIRNQAAVAIGTKTYFVSSAAAGGTQLLLTIGVKPATPAPTQPELESGATAILQKLVDNGFLNAEVLRAPREVKAAP